MSAPDSLRVFLANELTSEALVTKKEVKNTPFIIVRRPNCVYLQTMNSGNETPLKTLTLKLKERDMDAIDAMAAKKGMTKTALIKQALRVFQAIDERIERGDKLFVEDRDEQKAELLLL